MTEPALDSRRPPPMTTRWPSIVVATLCSLAIAASGSAECAWVLWSTVGENHSASGGFKSVEDCIKALDRYGARFAEQGAYRVTPTYLIYTVGQHTQSAKCLPDTIDPRGPKEK